MADTIEVKDTSGNGTFERVAYDLMERILRENRDLDRSKTGLLRLYFECRDTVRGSDQFTK